MDKSKLLPVIGIALFIMILMRSDLGAVSSIILAADPFLIALAFLLSVPIVLVKTVKWKILIRAKNVNVPFLKCVFAWMVGFTIGVFTPGRMGDVTKAYYLKDRLSPGRGIATVIMDRIIDLFTLFVLALLGAILISSSFSGLFLAEVSLFITLSFATFLFLSFILIAREGFVRRFVRPFFNRLTPVKYKGVMKLTFQDFYSGFNQLRKKKHLLFLSGLLSLLAFLLTIIQIYLISQALSIQIDSIILLMIIPIMILLDALPISISGIGTREAILITLLGIISIPVESALSLSIMIFLLSYLVLVPVGLLFWFIRPVRIRSLLESA